MSGDIAFEKEIQRTISVDIRYILFIIDKFANASHLIDEMTIAPSHKEKSKINEEKIIVPAKINAEEEKKETIKQETEKDFQGTLFPIIKTNSFNDAFKKAVLEYGSGENQKFWWKGNIYTTEQKRL